MTAHIVLDLHSFVLAFGKSCTIRIHCLHSQPMCPKMFSIDMSPPMSSYQIPNDTHGLSLTIFELLSWPQKRCRPSARLFDPDTVKTTAQ